MLSKPFFRHNCFNAAATETDRCVPCPSAHATNILSLCFHSASSCSRKPWVTCVHCLHCIVCFMSSVCCPQCSQNSSTFGNVQHFTRMSKSAPSIHFRSFRGSSLSSDSLFGLAILTPLSSLGARAYPHEQRDNGGRSNPLVPTGYTSCPLLKAVRGEGMYDIHCGAPSKPGAGRLLQWPTCGLSLAASGGPSQSNAMEVGGTGPAKRIKDDGLRCLAVGASSSCAGPADHLSARRDVMLVLGCKGINSGSGGCGLYLADVWRVMSIAVHRHSTTRCAGHTSPTSKAVSHCGCGIHLAWEGTTGKASPLYPVPQRHS